MSRVYAEGWRSEQCRIADGPRTAIMGRRTGVPVRAGISKGLHGRGRPCHDGNEPGRTPGHRSAGKLALVVMGALRQTPPMRVWLILAVGLLGWSSSRADRAEELASIHLEVLGGKERLAALGAFRATGTVTMAGKRVRFTLVAARPNKFRLDIEGGGRTLVQGYAGFGEPWQFDTGVWPPRYQAMDAANAKRFIADAEFDDALVGGKARGFSLDFAGEVKMEARTFLRILATHRLAETYALLVDPTTYLIEYRIESHPSSLGRPQQIVTRFDQYQGVEGVLLPFKITTTVDGNVAQVMEIERIDPNHSLTPETFSRPMVSPAPDPKSRPTGK